MSTCTYRGISLKPENENDVPVTRNNIASMTEIKQLGFFVLPNKLPTGADILLGYHHHLKVSGIPALTEIYIYLDGKISITTLGKRIDLKSVDIGTTVNVSKSGLVGHLIAVTKLAFCQGYTEDYSSGSTKVVRESWRSEDSAKETIVYCSTGCARVA